MNLTSSQFEIPFPDYNVFIAPPFGRWLHLKHTVSVYGSLTLEKRPGLTKQILKTLRPLSQQYGGGWINQIGLRNPGIEYYLDKNAKHNKKHPEILSLAALNSLDWKQFAYLLNQHFDQTGKRINLEFNLGCPNATCAALSAEDLLLFQNFPLQVKLGPKQSSKRLIEKYSDLGVRSFSLCNTLPTPKGGISGQRLQPHSLKLIAWAREQLPPETRIIGGGGIKTEEDLQTFLNAGADSLSLGTVFFTPLAASKLVKNIEHHFRGSDL